MFATAGKFTKNPADREDIVQSALERLIKIFSAPGKKRCISAGYIVFTTRSAAIDHLRRQGQDAEHCIHIDNDQLAEIAATDELLEDMLIPPDNVERLWAIWPELPADDRLLLEGRYILEMTDQELSQLIPCKPSSVRMKLTRARRRAFKLLTARSKDDDKA